MSDAQWVQHFSGQGEKYEVNDQHTNYLKAVAWQVHNQGAAGGYFYLPKVAYIPCPPPERWEVVQGSEWVIDSDGHSAKLRWGFWESGSIEAPAHVRFTTINEALVLERKVGG